MDNASTEVVTLRRQLEKSIANENLERVSDLLKTLGDVAVTLSMLKESKVGATVSKLKKHADEGVSSSAKALVKKWKKVAEASGVQATPSKAEKTEKPSQEMDIPVSPTEEGSSGGSSVQSPSSVANSGGKGSSASLSRKSSASSDASTEVQVDALLSQDGVAPSRLRMRRKLMETLLIDFTEGDRLGVATVAREVENAMNGNNPYVSKKDDYLGKARQLVFNLKKNDQLRQDVREGVVPPERLVVMTSTELMAKEKREAMDKAVHDRTEARRLDWHEKNADKINKQCGIKETEGMFECGRCKSTKTTYTQKQTRSADEPMTTFVTCGNCNNRWKFC